jgi:hypothetical protein
MKRLASVVAVVGALAGVGAGTASADANFAVQDASIDQKSVAIASAGSSFGSFNVNVAKASSANYASIGQWLVQVND